MGCNHNKLEKCEMGGQAWYRCTDCHDNFTVKPMEIAVEFPAAPAPVNTGIQPTDLAE